MKPWCNPLKGPWWATVIYLGLYSLIAFAVYFTHSAAPLLALFLQPDVDVNDGRTRGKDDAVEVQDEATGNRR